MKNIFAKTFVLLVLATCLCMGLALAAEENNDGVDIRWRPLSGMPGTSSGATTYHGDVFTNSLGMKFVYIKPGAFMMGSPSSESGRDDDEKQHRVTLTKGYYMQTTEVTQGQWKQVMGTRPWSGKDYVQKGDDYPAVYVSWKDAQKFINKLNQMEGGKNYRLPTEAQWEYACRAGSTTVYYYGDSADRLGKYAWYRENAWDTGNKYAHQVGQKQSNAWGLHDMHGNVWEWCQDWYNKKYLSGSVTDSTNIFSDLESEFRSSIGEDIFRERTTLGSSSGQYRVIRGGSWDYDARYCRSANHSGDFPGDRGYDLGFRLAKGQ